MQRGPVRAGATLPVRRVNSPACRRTPSQSPLTLRPRSTPRPAPHRPQVMEFAKFGANLDAVTKQQLHRGVRLVESLKQGQFNPLEIGFQINYIYWGVSGFLDTKKVPYIKKLQAAASAYFKKGDRRTNIDVIEVAGEVTPAWKSYLYYDIAQVEKAMGTNTLA